MKLSPIAIAKLLDLDLDAVIYKITWVKANDKNNWVDREKETRHIRKTYKNELYELDSLPQFFNDNAVSDDLRNVCLLRELISQCNQYPVALMKKVIECRKCVESIKFTDKFRYYDMFLSDENQLLIRKKLAECHLNEIGDSKIYKEFIASLE
jgi:hypothetical protein